MTGFTSSGAETIILGAALCRGAPTTPRPRKISSLEDGCWVIFAASARALSLTPSAVKSPEMVLLRCHAGRAFCCLFASASASLSIFRVASSLSVEITTPIPSSCLAVPSEPAILSPAPASFVLTELGSVRFRLIHELTSKLNTGQTGEVYTRESVLTQEGPWIHSFATPLE